MERTAMSSEDLKRWVVMRRIRDGSQSRRDAATVLGLSRRQVRRIFQRVRTRGQQGIIHGNVGRRSNRSHPPALRAEAVALIAALFSGVARGRGQRFGPHWPPSIGYCAHDPVWPYVCHLGRPGDRGEEPGGEGPRRTGRRTTRALPWRHRSRRTSTCRWTAVWIWR